jgi:hypothetical protein
MIGTGLMYLPKLGRDKTLPKLYVFGNLSVFNALFCNQSIMLVS